MNWWAQWRHNLKNSLCCLSCPTLCGPMDCSPPASSVLGVFQARIQERIAISCSRGSSQPRDPTASPALAGRFFTTSTTLGIGCIYKISLGKRILFRTKLAWASLVAQLGKNLPAMQETWVQSLSWEDPWRRDRLLTPVFWPGEFYGLYSPWGHKESDTTECLSLSVWPATGTLLMIKISSTHLPCSPLGVLLSLPLSIPSHF